MADRYRNGLIVRELRIGRSRLRKQPQTKDCWSRDQTSHRHRQHEVRIRSYRRPCAPLLFTGSVCLEPVLFGRQER